MKKNLLAVALTTALFGLGACAPEDVANVTNDGTVDTTSSTSSAAVAASSSVSFSARIPQPQASAQIINDDTSAIVVQLYHLSSVLDGASTYVDELTPNESGEIFDADGNYLGYKEDIQKNLDNLSTELTTFEQLTNPTDAELVAGYEFTWEKLNEFGALGGLSQFATPVEANLTQDNTTATIDGIRKGTYVIRLTQQNNTGAATSRQQMLATIGEGHHQIVANMMSGSWILVDDNDAPTPLTLSLLNNAHPDYKVDWDPDTDGDQNFLQGISDGKLSADAVLTQVHYYTGDNSQNAPVDFLYQVEDSAQEVTVLVPEYNDSDKSDNRLEGVFRQYYDHRLNGGVGESLASPNLMNVEFEITPADGGITFGGAMIWTHSMLVDGDNGDSWSSEDNRTYTDDSGNQQTLYVVHAGNYQSVMAQADDTQPDVFQTPPAQVSGGNLVSGNLVEYLGTSASRTTTGMTADDDSLKPEALAMAMAMATVERQAGLTATAAAEHPLGAQCAALTDTNIEKQATYGWVDGAWVAGEVNHRYINNSAETRNTYDLNGDGVASAFETGVVENYGSYQTSDNATAVFQVYSAYAADGDFSWLDGYQDYRVDGTFNEGDTYANVEYYIPTDAMDLSDSTTWQHAGSSDSTYHYVGADDGIERSISVQNNWNEENDDAQPLVRYVSDLDGDGTIEKYEGSADSPIYGEVRNGSYEVTVCVSPIRLRGEGLNTHVDNFRAGDPIVLNTGSSGTDVEVQ